jgi:TolB-like protein/class 3 adenylate cyclase
LASIASAISGLEQSMAEGGSQRRLAAIVAIDVAGYSRLMGADEQRALDDLKAHREAMTPLVQQHEGRLVGTAGDGLLLEFPSVVEAVSCAMVLQAAMAERNADIPEDKQMLFRVGINLGDVLVEGDDIYGDGVNVAARIEALAEPGGICISRSARDQVRDRLDVALEDMGEIDVKNIARPVRVFRVLGEGEAATARTQRRLSGRLAVSAVAVLLIAIAAAGGGYWWWQQQLDFETADKPAIAVLPFANLSADKEQEYFADGMTDDLITDLSKVSGLIVIARNSVFTYKGRNVKVQDVAKDLNVTHVIEGSVRRAGSQVRINAQLIDAKTGAHLWAEKFDRAYKDIFELQDEVTARITAAMKIELTPDEKKKLARRPTQNLEAYEAYLKAKEIHKNLNWEYLGIAFAHYQKAIRKDPTFAEAYAEDARLAVYVYFTSNITLFGPSQARQRYLNSSKRALELDPGNATALRARTSMLLLDGLRDEAVIIARRVVSSNPNSAAARISLAEALLYSGKIDEAQRAMAIALRLDPKPNPFDTHIAGLVNFANQNYERAASLYRRLVQNSPKSNLGHYGVMASNAKLGRLEIARAALKAVLDNWSDINLQLVAVQTRHWGSHITKPWLEAMRAAGLPEWPHDFKITVDNQLAGDEIKALLFGHRMVNRYSFGPKDGLQIDKNGTWQGSDGYATFAGTARIQDNLLCLVNRKATMGREYCVPVYRNPRGFKADRNEYVYPGLRNIHYFSVAE